MLAAGGFLKWDRKERRGEGMLKFESIGKRKQAHLEQYQKSLQREDTIEGILQTLRATKLGMSNAVNSIRHAWQQDTEYINIYIYNCPIDMVIDQFCVALRSKYNATFELDTRWNALRLTTTIMGICISFHISEGELASCELIRVPTKVRTDKELEEMRVEYTYRMNCG